MRTQAELSTELETQLKILASNCLEYDKGNQEFVLEICHRLRVILHQTNSSHSVLNQLGYTDLKFISTYDDRSPFQMSVENEIVSSIFGLVKTSPDFLGGSMYMYIPYLDDYKTSNPLTFEEWWQSEIICKYKDNYSLNRKKIVVDLFANKSGGSHLDPNISDLFLNINRLEDDVIGYKAFDGQGNRMPHKNSPFSGCARQIAHELFLSLKANFENLISRIYFSKIHKYNKTGHNRDVWRSSAKTEQTIEKTGDCICLNVAQDDKIIAFGISQYDLDLKITPKDLQFGIVGFENGELGVIEDGIVTKINRKYCTNDMLGIWIKNNTSIGFIHNNQEFHTNNSFLQANMKIYLMMKDGGTLKKVRKGTNMQF
jgi:hypothetical protein